MKGSSTPKTPPSTPLLEGSQNAAHRYAVQLMALLKDVAEPKQVMSTDNIQQLMDLLKIDKKENQGVNISFKQVDEIYVLPQVHYD